MVFHGNFGQLYLWFILLFVHFNVIYLLMQAYSLSRVKSFFYTFCCHLYCSSVSINLFLFLLMPLFFANFLGKIFYLLVAPFLFGCQLMTHFCGWFFLWKYCVGFMRFSRRSTHWLEIARYPVRFSDWWREM